MQITGPALIAVATGVIGSSWMAGAISSLSVITMPALEATSQLSPQAWAGIYNRGAAVMPKVAAGVALTYGYAAYEVGRQGGEWIGFGVATVGVLAIVPFTALVMAKTNTSLQKAAKDGMSASDARVSSLLDTWVWMNLARSFFPLAGAVMGVVTFFANWSY